MAFCENCGTQLSVGAKFCRSCGNPVGAVAAASAAAPAKKSSRLLKFILGAAAILVFLACLGAGAFYYLSHRASAKVAEVTQGLPDISSITKTLPVPESQTPAAPPAAPSPSAGLDPNKIVTASDGQCALFTKEELTRVLGTTFTHADADATGCTYKGDAPREWVRTEAHWKDGRRLVKERSDAYASLRQSMLSQHYTKAEIDSHIFPINPYPGVGDEAWVGLVNNVTARKGDAGIAMDLRYYHDSDELTKMLVNTALSRLGGNNSASGATPKPPVQ